jgi:uncharacterized protein (TIGR00730 family)
LPFRYSTGNSQLDLSIQDILHRAGASENREALHQMMVTIVKLAQDGADAGDIKIINSTLKEMRYAFKVMRPYRRVRKCAVFGSARCKPETEDYKQACEFASEIADRGFMVITGAGHGIMEAGNRGAGRERSFGLNIRLPFEQVSNPYIDKDEKLINFKYFFTRKLAFIKETHAVVCCPGGFGTHDEGLEALTLIQTGKSHMVPIVFLHPPGSHFWTDWHQYNVDRLLQRGMISPQDLSLYRVTSSVQEACKEVENFYRRFHSMRYVRDMLIVRLEAAVSDEEVELLNEEFGDLLKSGTIEPTLALPEEQDKTIAHLPRLKFHFRRRAFGRLRELVDRLNSFDLPAHSSIEVPEAGAGGLLPSEMDEDPTNGG